MRLGERGQRGSRIGADRAVGTRAIAEAGRNTIDLHIVKLNGPKEPLDDGVPLEFASELLWVPAAEQDFGLLLRVIGHVPRVDVLVELLRLHKGIKQRGDAFLGELRVGHADQGVKLSVEDAMLNDHAKRPVRHGKLILHVIWTSEHNLISNEIAANFTATEADPYPALFALRRLFEIRGNFRVEGMALVLRVHVGCSLLGKNPGVGASRVEDGSNLLRLSRADIELTNVGKVL